MNAEKWIRTTRVGTFVLGWGWMGFLGFLEAKGGEGVLCPVVGLSLFTPEGVPFDSVRMGSWKGGEGSLGLMYFVMQQGKSKDVVLNNKTCLILEGIGGLGEDVSERDYYRVGGRFSVTFGGDLWGMNTNLVGVGVSYGELSERGEAFMEYSLELSMYFLSMYVSPFNVQLLHVRSLGESFTWDSVGREHWKVRLGFFKVLIPLLWGGE